MAERHRIPRWVWPVIFVPIVLALIKAPWLELLFSSKPSQPAISINVQNPPVIQVGSTREAGTPNQVPTTEEIIASMTGKWRAGTDSCRWAFVLTRRGNDLLALYSDGKIAVRFAIERLHADRLVVRADRKDAELWVDANHLNYSAGGSIKEFSRCD